MAKLRGSRLISLENSSLDVNVISINNPLNLATKMISVCGRVVEVDVVGDDYWDVWPPSGKWAELSTPRQHNIVSDDSNDTLLGDGARVVEVSGLDSSYNLISETVDMDGISNVLTTLTYKIIHKLMVVEAGTDEFNQGTITAIADVDSQLMAQMDANYNESLMAIYQIPNGFTGYIPEVFTSTNRHTSTNDSDTRLVVKPFGQAFQTKYLNYNNAEGASSYTKRYQIPLMFPEKSIIKLQFQPEQDNTDIAGGFDIALVPN